MKYGRIDGLNKPVSRVVLGTMIVTIAEKERSFALLDAACEAGINAVDVAHVYGGGQSERCVGAWLREHGVRETFVIITKGCHPNQDRKRVTPFDLAADLHDSLARLQTDYIDVYLLHRDDPSVPVGPIVRALNEHHRKGRIRAFGGSNWSHQRIQEANDYARKHGLVPFTASSPNFGLAEQVEDPWGPGCETISGPGKAEARAWYRRNRMPVLAYSSLGRGLFSGRMTRDNFKEISDGACARAYCHEVNFQRLDRARQLAAERGVNVTQIALAYVLQQPLKTFALVGAASKEECVANAAAVEIKLSAKELAWLDMGGECPNHAKP